MSKRSFFIGVTFWGLLTSVSYADSGTTVSDRGATFTLAVDGTITQATEVALICSSQPMALKSVKLWMNAHGHGSTPTSLAVVNDHCGRVEQLNFIMAGRWDIRVETTTGEKAVFGVDVP